MRYCPLRKWPANGGPGKEGLVGGARGQVRGVRREERGAASHFEGVFASVVVEPEQR